MDNKIKQSELSWMAMIFLFIALICLSITFFPMPDQLAWGLRIYCGVFIVSAIIFLGFLIYFIHK